MSKQSINLNIQQLPIKSKQILYLISISNCLIVTAQTGSGKTTQIPQILLQAGYCSNNQKIAVILPRRIGCITLSKRISQQLNAQVGVVSYHIRFQNTQKENTKIKLITDGMMLKQMLNDILLQQYSIIMVDDIHQRSLNTDILLGFLKKIQKKRPKLKLIISSATINSQQLKAFFMRGYTSRDNFICNIFNVKGRLYKVDIYYLRNPCKNYILKAVQTSIKIHQQKHYGDILVFLTSQQEIEIFIYLMKNYIEQNRPKTKIMLLPLYAGLQFDQQMKVFDLCPLHTRKIIASTNIAQSTITIQGIVYIIDCGFQKVRQANSILNLQSLVIVPVSKSNADQRAGRAGRNRPGQCYRLYQEQSYQNLLNNTIPEICRVSLMDYVLIIKSLGIQDLSSFQLVNKPPQLNLIKGIQNLHALGIINDNFEFLDLGQFIAQLPFETKISAMIINSFKQMYGCSEQIMILASMLALQSRIFLNVEPLSILKAKKKIGCKEGDFLTMINIFLKYYHSSKGERKRFCQQNKLNQKTLQSAGQICNQIKQNIRSFRRKLNKENNIQSQFKFENKSSADDPEPILRCILSSFFLNIAQIQIDGTYKNYQSNQICHLHSTSILTVNPPQWIVYHEVLKTNNKYTIRNASQLFEIAGHYFQDSRQSNLNQQHKIQVIYQNQKQHLRKQDKGFDVIKKQQKVNLGNKINFIPIKKKQIFDKSVLGLKQKKNVNKLSFDEEDI